jgi:hypothetical protein
MAAREATSTRVFMVGAVRGVLGRASVDPTSVEDMER